LKAQSYSANLNSLILALAMGLPATQVFATTQITPLLGLNHTFINTDSNRAGSQAGGVSVISPGLDYSLESRHTTIDMSLLVDAEYYTGLDRDNRVLPNLDLGAIFDHDPGRWKSTLAANIQQVNDSVDGIQSLSQETFNPRTKELRTFSAGTNYNNRLSSTIDYLASVGVDRTKLEGDDPTNGANLDLSINNFRSGNPFTWTGAVATAVTDTEGDKTQIDVLELTLYYQINSRYKAFTDLTGWRTSEDDSGQDNGEVKESFILGLAWANTQDNFIRVGIGEFDGEVSYSLNAQLTRRRSILTASYTDGVTSARTDTLGRDGNSTGALDSQSLTATPVLQKRADLGFSLQGRRSVFGLSLFDYSREPIGPGSTEDGSGFAITFSRTLPRLASAGIDIRGQRTRLTETNDVGEFNAYYQKPLGKNLEAKVDLNLSKQTSTNEDNEYEQAQLGFSLSMSF
jgi:hypothetical protein